MKFEHESDTGGRTVDLEYMMRRAARGELIGEVSHPIKRPEESQEAFCMRVATIDLERACCIASNPRLTAEGKLAVTIEPMGARADVLVQMLERGQTPKFGYRAMMDDETITFITFDLINAPF